MDENKVQEIIKKMKARTTEELSTIVQENDTDQWTEEAFEAIHRILKNREHVKEDIKNPVTNKDFEEIVSIITIENSSVSEDIRKFSMNALINNKDPKILSLLKKASADTSISKMRRCDVIHLPIISISNGL